MGHRLDQRDLGLREWLRGPPTQRQGAEDPSTAPDRHACEPVDPFLPDHGAGGRQQVGRLARVSQRDRAPAHHDPADHTFADREDAVDLAQKRPQSAVAPQMQRRAVGRQEMQARDLVAGDVRERVERDAEHLVDVEARADRLADRVQDAEVRVRVARLIGPRALDDLPQASELLVAGAREIERVAVQVGADEDRHDFHAARAVRERDGEPGGRPGLDHATRTHLDAGGAQIDRGRVPFRTGGLAHPDRKRDGSARGAAPRAVRLQRRAPPRRRRRAEAREQLLETPEGQGLADEVEGAQPERFLGLSFRHVAGDDEDRRAQLAHCLELKEVEPAHPGETDVEQDDVGPLAPEQVERRLGRVHDPRLVAESDKELLQQVTNDRIVLDDEYAHDGSGWSPPLRPYPATPVPGPGTVRKASEQRGF